MLLILIRNTDSGKEITVKTLFSCERAKGVQLWNKCFILTCTLWLTYSELAFFGSVGGFLGRILPPPELRLSVVPFLWRILPHVNYYQVLYPFSG